MIQRVAAATYGDSVFLNVPFDPPYITLLHAVSFAVHSCGYEARIAVEATDTNTTRLDKILSIIKGSKYAICDLSRVELGATGLPRFNMPFETGLFWGCMCFGRGNHGAKRLLVLDSEPGRYQSALSDIAGQDIQVHGNEPQRVIGCVRTFLASCTEGRKLPGAAAIFKKYEQFTNRLPSLAKKIQVGRAELQSLEYIPDYLYLVATWLRKTEPDSRPSTG